jgi:hypothetical protein
MSPPSPPARSAVRPDDSPAHSAPAHRGMRRYLLQPPLATAVPGIRTQYTNSDLPISRAATTADDVLLVVGFGQHRLLISSPRSHSYRMWTPADIATGTTNLVPVLDVATVKCPTRHPTPCSITASQNHRVYGVDRRPPGNFHPGTGDRKVNLARSKLRRSIAITSFKAMSLRYEGKPRGIT